MKKIIFLFAGAVASFLLLSYVEEYENLISPFFSSGAPAPKLAAADISSRAKGVIEDFNGAISEVYLESDASLLSQRGIDEALIPAIAEDIAYLKSKGKIMDFDVREVKVEGLGEISPGIIQVSTKELVVVRYLHAADKTEISAYSPAVHNMRYVIALQGDVPRILSFETVGAAKR